MGRPIFPLVVHLPASPSIWPAVASLPRGLLINNPVRHRGAYDDVCYKGGIVGDGCELASTLCKYDLREGDLFVLSCCWYQFGLKLTGLTWRP